MDPTHPLYLICSFLGFFLSIITLPWHLEALNSGTCFFMIWTALACLNKFVNAIIWMDHAKNVAPIFCEISIRIMLAVSVGIPLSGLCIARRLYGIASCKSVTVSKAEKYRAVLIDCLICLGGPALFVPLQYVVQAHRFDIYEQIGCYPAIYNTPLTYVLTFMWPVLIGMVSAVYCTLSFIEFGRRQQQFNEFLASNNSVSVSRYFRLMALSVSEVMCTVPLGVFVIVINTKFTKPRPWISWEDTHYDYGRIVHMLAHTWRSQTVTVISFELERWLPVFCAFQFFMFFGFAQEARKNYATAFWWTLSWFGIQRPSVTRSSALAASLGYRDPKSPNAPPVYTPAPAQHKRQHSLSSSLAYSLQEDNLVKMQDIKEPWASTDASPSRPSSDSAHLSLDNCLKFDDPQIARAGDEDLEMQKQTSSLESPRQSFTAARVHSLSPSLGEPRAL